MAEPNDPPPLRVIVVGAGFAGLSAARTLAGADTEVSVTVLEAGSAVGGRARAGQLPSGLSVELGATWFHGVRDNPVYDMAVWQGVVKDVRKDPEVQKHDIEWQLHFARPLEPQLLAGELNTVALEAVGRYTEAAEVCTQGALLGDSSVGDVLRRTFDEAISGEGFTEAKLQTFADAWHFREKLQRTFDGFFSTDDVSLAFAREYEALDGPNLAVPGGYQALAATFAQGLDIRTNHRVTRIEYGHVGVRVTCDNGAVLEADCVIVTTSLGVLQSYHESLFSPPLPPWKRAAMDALRIGVADKVFVEFEIAPDKTKEAAHWLSSHATSSPAHSAAGASAQPSPSPEHSGRGAGTHPSPGSAALTSPSPVNSAGLPHTGPGAAGPVSSAGGTPNVADISGSGPHGPAHGGVHSEAACMVRRASPLTADSVMAAATSAAHLSLSEDTAVSSLTTGHPALHTGGHLMPCLDPSHPSNAAAVTLQQLSAASVSNTPSIHPQMGGVGATWRDGIGAAASLASTELQLLQQQQQHGHHRTSLGSQNPTRTARRRKQKRTIHSYAFLWPVHNPLEQGSAGHPAQVLDTAALAGQPAPLPPLCVDRLASPHVLAGLDLPAWLQGLHSIRYCPGPEWIEPSLLQDNGSGKRSVSAAERITPAVNPVDGGATHVSGVLWITGHAALAMEAASDEEVGHALTAMFKVFPQVPVPPGAIMPPRVLRTRWGTDPLFRGSYSYINVCETTGKAVDDMAEPLCNDQGVPIVLFAGEATHRQYIGTVHGAFLSGWREAQRLLDLLRLVSASPTAAHAESMGAAMMNTAAPPTVFGTVGPEAVPAAS